MRNHIMLTALVFGLVLLGSTNAFVQDIPFGKIWLSPGETHLFDLSEYFRGFNLEFVIDNTTKTVPSYVNVTEKVHQVENLGYTPNYNMTASHAVYNLTSRQLSQLWMLLTDLTLVNGTFGDDESLPKTYEVTTWLDDTTNIVCYDFVMDYLDPNVTYIDCSTVNPEDPLDYQNTLYIWNISSKELLSQVSTDPWEPTLPQSVKRQLRQIGIQENRTLVRYQKLKDYPTGWAKDTFLEFLDISDPATPKQLKVLKGEDFDLDILRVTDITVLLTDIYLVDNQNGVFRFTYNSITSQTQAIRYYQLPILGRKPTNIQSYLEFFEGTTRIIIIVSDEREINEYDWTSISAPFLVSDYQLGPTDGPIVALALNQQFIISQTRNDKVTLINIYQRNTRLYEEIYQLMSFTNPDEYTNSYIYFNALKSTFFHQLATGAVSFALNSSLLLFTAVNPPGDKNTFNLVVKEKTLSTPVQISVNVFTDPNGTSIQDSGITTQRKVAAFNGDDFSIQLEGLVVGPSLNYTIDSDQITVHQSVISNLTVYFDGDPDALDTMPKTWASWEQDPTSDYVYYYVQNSTDMVLNVYQCIVYQWANSLNCTHSYVVPMDGTKITSLSIGQQTFAVIRDNNKLVEVINKINGQSVTEIILGDTDGCNDLSFITFFGGEYLLCAQPSNASIVVYNATDPKFAKLGWITIPGSQPQFIYTNPELDTVIFVKNNDVLWIMQIGTWQILYTINSTATNTADKNWHVAMTERHLAIISASANTIEEWDIYNINTPFLTKEYPLYGYQPLLRNGRKPTYDYSQHSNLLFVTAMDSQTNQYILIYRMGRTTVDVLYKVVPLNTTVPITSTPFLQSISLSKDYEYMVLIQDNIVVAKEVQATPWIQLTPNISWTTDRMANLTFNVNVTNDWNEKPQVFEYKVVFWNSIDNISASTFVNDLDLSSIINVNSEGIFPQEFEIPDDLIFNGSVITETIECDKGADCDNDVIQFRDHIALNNQSVNTTAVSFRDFAINSQKIYGVSRDSVFQYDIMDQGTIENIINIPVPGIGGGDFECLRVITDDDNTYLVVFCQNTTSFNTTIALISTVSSKPILLDYIVTSEIDAINQVRLVNDYLFILDNVREHWGAQDAKIVVYNIDIESAEGFGEIITYVDTLDALPIGVEFLRVSSFEVLQNLEPGASATSFVVFLLDPFFGIRYITADFTTVPTTYTHTPYDLYALLAPFQILQDVVFSSIAVNHLPGPDGKASPSSYYDLIITTQNSNHFGAFFDSKQPNGNFTVYEVFQRYSSLSVLNRLQYTSKYFLVYAFPQNTLMATQSQLFVLYKRNPWNNTNIQPVYKNVYAGLNYKALNLTTVNFDMVEFKDLDGNNRTSFVFASSESYYKFSSYDVFDRVKVIINSDDIESDTVDIKAMNDFNSQTVTIRVNSKSWFQRNMTWIVIVTVLLAVVIIGGGGLLLYKKCADEEKKAGLLDE